MSVTRDEVKEKLNAMSSAAGILGGAGIVQYKDIDEQHLDLCKAIDTEMPESKLREALKTLVNKIGVGPNGAPRYFRVKEGELFGVIFSKPMWISLRAFRNENDPKPQLRMTVRISEQGSEEFDPSEFAD